jgi:putative Holliday junction resolvase
MSSTIIALDIGGRRIGVARAHTSVNIASPLTTLLNDDQIIPNLQRLIAEHDVSAIVVGLPRGLQGQHTEQTHTVEAFVLAIKQSIELPIYWQDEAVTSKQAEAELQARRKPYTKGDIDALAATYILEDFLREGSGFRP